MEQIKYIFRGRYKGFDNHGYRRQGTYKYVYDHIPTYQDIKEKERLDFGYMELFLESYNITQSITKTIVGETKWKREI